MASESSKSSIKRWWADRPMTYGTRHGDASYQAAGGAVEAVTPGTPEFFAKVDENFYAWTEILHSSDGRFAKIFPYDRYRGRRVLEIGCGLGTMAMNWARHGALVTAMDLNPVAVTQTALRFRLFGIPGRTTQVDGNALAIRDAAFDYVYSWGVLHHSPDLPRSISELLRVLRPGGEFGVMLYHRHSIRYYYLVRYLEGFLHRESRYLDPLALASRYTDGIESEGNPHTWPVTRREMERLFGPACERFRIDTFGEELDSMFDLMLPKVGRLVPKALRDVWGRRWGWSLWMTGTKKRS
jgi:ubiquinone/menaquinone biosynthesis C-methylase UbiE